MDFLKKLFGKNEPVITTPAQTIPGIEPIIVQAVENLFPDVNTRKSVFKVILELTKERKGVADLKTLLALLCYSKGNVEKFQDSAWQSHPHFWMDEIEPIFPTMKDAEEWVRSISKKTLRP